MHQFNPRRYQPQAVISKVVSAYIQARRYNRKVSAVSFNHGQETHAFVSGRWVPASSLKAA